MAICNPIRKIISMKIKGIASFFLSAACLLQTADAQIYVFGDSHVRAFNGIEQCVTHEVGPVLMHRVGRDGTGVLDIRGRGVEEGSTVIYAFGEIDVRCHIGKQRDHKNREVDEILEALAKNYLGTVLENRSRYHRLETIIYSIVPPTDIINNPEFPIYGSIEDRVVITQRLNEILRRLCDENGIKFLDVYHDYADQEGTLRVELSDGNVHISAECNGAIREKLCALRNQ